MSQPCNDIPKESMPSDLAIFARDPFPMHRTSVRTIMLHDIDRQRDAQGKDATEFSTYLRMVRRHLADSRELRLPDISKPELALYYLKGLEKVVGENFICNPLGAGSDSLLVVWDDTRDYFNLTENIVHTASASALLFVLNHDGWTWNVFSSYRHDGDNIWYILPMYAVVNCTQIPEEKYAAVEQVQVCSIGGNIPSQLLGTAIVPLNVALRYCLGFITLLNMGGAVVRCTMSEPAGDSSGSWSPGYVELIQEHTSSLH